MREFILDLLKKLGISNGLLNPLYYVILSAAVIVICIVLELFARWVILSLFFRITKNSKRPIIRFLKKHRFRKVLIGNCFRGLHHIRNTCTTVGITTGIGMAGTGVLLKPGTTPLTSWILHVGHFRLNILNRWK